MSKAPSSATVFCRGQERRVSEFSGPDILDRLVEGSRPWIVELGFGKGRYVLRRAAEGANRCLGIEVAAKYYRQARDRALRGGYENLTLIRGDALYLMSVFLPKAFAAEVHVYFPDPWPKARHHKRRLLHEETIDLVLGLLARDGRLFFATDHVEYGQAVEEVMCTHPALEVRRRPGPWPGGSRTNYEAKYMSDGREVLRLEARLVAGFDGYPFHPRGRRAILAVASPAGTANLGGLES